MSEDYGFKFAIGQHLTLAAAVVEAEYANGRFPSKAFGAIRVPRLVVVGRQLEQCYGGTQRHYDCRHVHGSTTVGSDAVGFSAGDRVKGLCSLSEPELIEFPQASGEALAAGK